MAYFRNSKSHKWKVIKKIGNGGNGVVFEVENKKRERFALKELSRVKNKKSYQRFKDEITILNSLMPQAGIMNIVDSYLPSHFSPRDKPFYVMPKGIPLQNFLKGKSHEDLYKIFIKISKALEFLHANNVTHRDIKPANILVVENEPVLADFGLANFPTKKKISSLKEAIGPKWTIAPEMQRISSTAEFKKADIYSLAKTLWILITGNSFGFEGQYIPESSISIVSYIKVIINEPHFVGTWHYYSTVLLEKLLIDCTSNDAEKRPDISEFISRLEYWLLSNDEYEARNPYEWENAIKRIFPHGIPNHCEWTGVDDIISILEILTQYSSLNHMFFPDGGGLDLTEIKKAQEDGCINLLEDNIVKPSVLTFDMIGDLNWSFFRLDLAPLTSLTNTKSNREDVYMDSNGNYSIMQLEGYDLVFRYLRGAFIFVFKTSIMNDLPGKLDGYMGFHSKVNAAEYKAALTKLKNML